MIEPKLLTQALLTNVLKKQQLVAEKKIKNRSKSHHSLVMKFEVSNLKKTKVTFFPVTVSPTKVVWSGLYACVCWRCLQRGSVLGSCQGVRKESGIHVHWGWCLHIACLITLQEVM